MGAALRIACSGIVLVVLWAAAVAGFALYANQYHLDDAAHGDGIVVLTGGGGRVEYGLDLLASGRGRALFISGVGKEVPMADLLEKAPQTTRLILSTFSGGRITLGRSATNTIGNAEESAQWIEERHYKSVLLVTADYHMPRALLEFESKLPKDMVIIPAPVKTHNFADFSWVHDVETRDLVLSEFHKLIAARLRHFLISL